MKKASHANNDYKPDVDKAKKIYRAAIDAIHRLDDISKSEKPYREVFSQDAVTLRNKLKEYLERLMFFNPAEYGRKAEEVLWRKVFYECMQIVKHNRKHVRPHGSLETAYRTHLASAAGYYQHLLFRLQQEFSLQLSGLLDFHFAADHRTAKKITSNKKVSSHVKEWALKAAHRCLICLGDIARYQQDFDHGLSAVNAERYYHQAIMLFPDLGMPHNQLGTLSGSAMFGCESAYYYLRCLACEKPFEGAHGNLKRLFEKNHKRYADVAKESQLDMPPEERRPHDIRKFIISFIHLLEIFHDPTRNVDQHDIQVTCQNTLQDFNLCMFYEPGSDARLEEDEQLQYLNDDFIFKLVVICISTVHLLQKQKSRRLTAAIAFLLALFSHILNHVCIRMQGALYEKENPNKLLQGMDNGALNDGDTSQDESITEPGRENHQGDNAPKKLLQKRSPDPQGNGESGRDAGSETMDNGTQREKHTKVSRGTRLKNLRRRRRRHPSEDSDVSDLSETSDLSEGYPDAENFLSDDSAEDLFSYFDHDSDSDVSDSGLMDSQELSHGFAQRNPQQQQHQQQQQPQPPQPPQPPPQDDNNSSLCAAAAAGGGGGASSSANHAPLLMNSSHCWADPGTSSNLALLSTELFSSSMTLHGHNFNFPERNNMYERDVAEFENCKDVIQGKKNVPVPPGFSTSIEARHAVEISEKLANFVIETDTDIGPTDTEHSTVTETEPEDDSSSASVGDQDKGEREQQHLHFLMDVIHVEGLLPSVKLMADWMQCHASIITTCAQSSQSLWHRMSVLLNFLPVEQDIAKLEQCWQEELGMVVRECRQESWRQTFPLAEDVAVMQLPPLGEVHSGIRFDSQHRAALSDFQETFLRVCCLRHFGYWLAGMKSLEFHYQEDQGLFLGPTKADMAAPDAEKDAQERMRDAESRRNQLMRDMAQLRLQAEVSQLEGTLQSSDSQAMFPPYLLPDTAALCLHLPLVRAIAQAARGIMVIPLSVIDNLDVMKKDSIGAREAIRWLESEFRKGNRFIRAQKSNETMAGQTVKIWRKKNKELWCMLETLECARYLAQQSGNISSGNMVALLTGSAQASVLLEMPAVQQVLASSRQEGVSVELITEFANKWKDTSKNKG